MSNELEQELNKKTKAKKLAKLDLTIFDNAEGHLKCFIYMEEGPTGKLEPWRIKPVEFLKIGGDRLSALSSFIESYTDGSLDAEKPLKIARYVLEVDTEFTVDPDYILYRETGTKGKRKPTRLGVNEWWSEIKAQIGSNAFDDLKQFTT